MDTTTIQDLIEEVLSEKSEDRSLAYHQDVHSSVFLGCPLKYFLGSLPLGSTFSTPSLIAMELGNWNDSWMKELFENQFGPTEQDQYTHGAIIYQPDYVHKDWVAEFKFTKHLRNGKPMPKDEDQLAYYCAVTQKQQGFLIYTCHTVYNPEMETFEPGIRVFEYTFSKGQLFGLMDYLYEEGAKLLFLFSIWKDKEIQHDDRIKPRYKWECKYCNYTLQCEEIKEKQNMPYEEIESEFPPTKSLDEEGASVEGIYLSVKSIEIVPKDGTPP